MIRVGTCQLCGETAALYASEDLPEEFEGVGCISCCEFHAIETEKRNHREQAKREAKQW